MTSPKAPTGRQTTAQGKEPRDAALGPPPPQIQSPEGAAQTPVAWITVSVGDLASEVRYGSSAKTSSDHRGVPVLRMGNLVEGKLDLGNLKFLPSDHGEFPDLFLEPGDVLFNRTNSAELVGKTAVYRGIPTPCSFASYLIRLRLEGAMSEWLSYYLNSPFGRSQINAVVSQQVGQANVNGTKLRAFRFPLPPLAEQRRIVAKIEELFSELDTGEESLRKARRQLGVYRQSLLKQAFEGKLTAHWRKQNPHLLESPEQLLSHIQEQREARYEQQLKEWDKAGRLGRRPSAPAPISALTEDERVFGGHLPPGWKSVPAEAMGDVQLGRQRSPKNQSKDYPTKYIRAANITESGLALDDILEMEFSPQERRTFTLQAGDLVLSEASGSASQVGKPAMWRGEIPDCCFQNTVIRQRLFDREQSVFYLWLYRFFYLHGIFSRTAGGVGINHLSAGKFSRLPVPLCSLPEQQEIVRLLDEQFTVIEQNEREIDAALKRSAALRQSILKKAFSGQLVAQDPADEPAGVLLERIRKEREGVARGRKVSR